jgi:hypothetical protein
MTQNQGALQFINLAEQVMELDQVVRQREDQQHFKGLLERMRIGWLTDQDEHRLRTLILDDDNYTPKEIKDISDKALHLFSKHEPKNAHNEKKLQETVSEDNPLACIRCIDTSTDSTDAKLRKKHLKKVFDMKRTMLCREAMVEIVKANIEPKWGLYNGAIGTVVDIVYHQGENPNNGHLPKVVVVDFKHYRGPIWDKNNPTHVPIAPIQRRCERCCCTRRQVPLQIAWAKTIHSIQGHNAGPTGPNQSPNAIQSSVCDLGTRNCETLNPGMSYVATSRATTIGDCGTGEVIPRKCTNSAIYFKAGTFQTGLKCLTHSHKGVEYKRVQERTAWVSYLDRQQEQTSTVDDESEKMEIQQWMENEKYTRDQLLSVVRSQSWRQNKSFKLPKTTTIAYTQKQKNTLLSPIQSSLSSLLHPGISMRGYQIG